MGEQGFAVELRRVLLERVRIPLLEPFRISSGAVDEKDVVLVTIESDRGAGVGEASPMGGAFYSAETPDSTWRALTETLVPALLREPSCDLERLEALFRAFPGEPFAKAGLEGAFWDLRARAEERPLCELLGGSARPIPSGVAIGIYPTAGELLDRVERYLADGYRRVKIKIAPGWDVEPVEAVRRRFPTTPLMVDCNAAYSIDDVEVFRELDRFDLMMVEQPLGRDALEEHAELQRRIRSPICLDESAESLEALETIVRLRSCRIVNIKVQRVGGLAAARAMHDQARAAQLPCWLGTMPELGIASAQGLHLAMLENFTFPTDVEASSRWYTDDVVNPAITIDRGGWIHIPPGPGAGYRLDRAKVERYRSARLELEP